MIGDRLKEIRTERGLTLTALARQIDYAYSTVACVETGHDKPSKRLLRDLCRVLGVNQEWMINGTGPKYAENGNE